MRRTPAPCLLPLLLLLLAACQKPDRTAGVPVSEEPAPVVMEEAAPARDPLAPCVPGDDGIGGTGCPRID